MIGSGEPNLTTCSSHYRSFWLQSYENRKLHELATGDKQPVLAHPLNRFEYLENIFSIRKQASLLRG